MTLLPQVRDQLDAAAHRKARQRPRHDRFRGVGWLRSVGAKIPAAASTATAVAIAVIAITALHSSSRRTAPPGQHNPATRHVSPAVVVPPGPAQQQAINAAINKATNQAVHSDHACQSENRGQTRVHGSPGAQLLSQLGVLRRPAISSPSLQTLLGGGFSAGARVYVDYIRLAQVAYGSAFYLIPEGNPSGRGSIPARCYTEMRTRLKRLTGRLPAGERAAALQEQSQAFRMMRAQRQPGLCFAIVTTRHVRPPNGVNSGCGSTTAFLQPGLDSGVGQGDRAGGQIFAAIVPDSVASVTMKFSASAKDPARTLTARAINNVVVFKIPPHTAHADLPSAIIRRSADGRIISSTG